MASNYIAFFVKVRFLTLFSNYRSWFGAGLNDVLAVCVQ